MMDREVGKLIGIIFLISVLVLIAGFIIFLSISHPEKRLDVGANIGNHSVFFSNHCG